MQDVESLVSKIKFDAEDRLPPAYWNRLRSVPKENNNDEIISKNENSINPNEWVQAPKFIPQHKQSLVNSFGYVNPLSNMSNDNHYMNYDQHNPINNVNVYSFTDSNALQTIQPTTYDFQPSFSTNYPISQIPLQSTNINCVPFNSNTTQKYDIPKGYSANFTAINSGIGPPIAAIVLKKKRKRRQKNKEQKYDKNVNKFTTTVSKNDKTSTTSTSIDRDSQLNKNYLSEQNLHNSISYDSLPRSELSLVDRKTRSYSCPHFSDEQLTIWDDFLYNAICNKNKKQILKKKNVQMSSLKNEENFQNLNNNHHASLNNSFQSNNNNFIQKNNNVVENNNLKNLHNENEKKNKKYIIKPFLYDNNKSSQWTMWNNNELNHELCNPVYDFDGKVEEDFYEGMRIQVNHFDNNLEDMTITENDNNDKQSTFSQMQWAMRHKRSCCNII